MNVVDLPNRETLYLQASAPLVTARLFMNRMASFRGQSLLWIQKEQWYWFDGQYFGPIDLQEIRNKIYEFLSEVRTLDKEGKDQPFNPTTNKVNNVIDALKSLVTLESDICSPHWFKKNDGMAATDILCCANGLLHFPNRIMIKHTPELFLTNKVRFDYDRLADCPKWEEFLQQIFSHDMGCAKTLQEMFGYLLTQDTSYQKAFFLVGPKRSGKGTIARVLSALVGNHNVVGTTLGSLTTGFGLQPMLDKTVALISDARISTRPDMHVITERILSITGEDFISVDRKFMSSKTVKLNTRIVMMSNELPRLTDSSGALASRFVIMTMERSFYGEEKIGLTQDLLSELPGILNWAIRGLDRLREQGRFTIAQTSREIMEEMEDLGSPISAFVRDKCVIHPAESVSYALIYEEWSRWCEATGRRPGSSQTFGRDLRSVVPGLKTMRPGTKDRVRSYAGIGIKPEW